MSEDRQVVILNAEFRHSIIYAGLLSIHGDTRSRLANPIDIDLYDGSTFVAKVSLGKQFQGDRNGYIRDTTLEIT